VTSIQVSASASRASGSLPREDAARLRASIDDAVARGEAPLAQIRELFFGAPGLAAARFVSDRMKRIAERRPTRACRLAFARSFTVEPVIPLLEAAARLDGLRLDVHVGDFNTYAQDLLDPAGALHAFAPDVVVLAVQTRDVVPELWQDFSGLTADAVEQAVERTVEAYRAWISAFRSHSDAALVLHNLELPAEPDMGVLDAQSARGQVHILHELNRRLADLAGGWPGVHVLDYDGLVARHGRERWHDERRWLTARMPIAADCLWPLANEYLRFLLPLSGVVAKALVVDLDNTLWGGVLGEDGRDGIVLDGEYPGAGFLALQRAILALHARGVILAVSSKNDHADAMAVLEHDPRMLLRPHHLAAARINWNPKTQSLREIAGELNIGLDSLVFLDDNPVEREQVRQALPEVTVIDLPQDPMEYARALRGCAVLERVSVSAEDRVRGRYYADQRLRTELQQSVASVEDYLRSLGTELTMAEVARANVTRVAQLTQKTNQFNLTTRRYTEAQVAAMAADPLVRVYEASVSDRFGDNGLVGVAITREVGATCEIDTLLMSCRVIGRTVETAMLAEIARDAGSRGSERIQGWFLPSPKNAPASDFYRRHGFVLAAEREDGALWELDLRAAPPMSPGWIRVRRGEGDSA
jgi:FkbH-like protein